MERSTCAKRLAGWRRVMLTAARRSCFSAQPAREDATRPGRTPTDVRPWASILVTSLMRLSLRLAQLIAIQLVDEPLRLRRRWIRRGLLPQRFRFVIRRHGSIATGGRQPRRRASARADGLEFKFIRLGIGDVEFGDSSPLSAKGDLAFTPPLSCTGSNSPVVPRK